MPMFFKSTKQEFEHLTWPLSAELLRLALYRLANRQDAEDAIQETYLRAYRSFKTFKPGSNIKAWMTRILLNVVSDSLTSRGKTDFHEDIEEEALSTADQSLSARDPELQLLEAEMHPVLVEALNSLPAALLYPLLLRELEDMTYSDIASVLNVPVGTVMSRLFRARRLVKERLKGKNFQTAGEVNASELH